MEASTVWKSCLEEITRYISDQHFTTWFQPIKVVGGREGELELEVPNRFFLEWIKDHYLPLIKEVLKKKTNRNYSLVWKISENSHPEKKPVKERQKVRTNTKKALLGSELCSRYTFENFVVGKTNEFAHAACFAVSNHLGSKYNPLFIYGSVGLGKTHLLQAIGNRVLERDEPLRVCYYTSEKFMNEFINYISRNRMDEFRRKFRNVDLLLIDDIQFWSGKGRTQEEFFHTFNALYEARKQIVLTSDRYPKDMDGIEERLRSRFEWGLVADIQPPDLETKIAILKKKASNEGIELPDDVAEWLAKVSGSNVRELEGYLNKIIAISSLTGRDINLTMCKESLKNQVRFEERRALSIEEIQKVVAREFNVKLSDLKSKRRYKTISLPRQIAMFIAREYGKFSFPEIGSAFGGKDHSTAIHAVKKIEKLLSEDKELKNRVNKIINRLSVG